MFGSCNPFGQSSNSPFGSPSGFGQSNAASNYPFAPHPFRSTSPFGSQSGGSMFGGTSTGVFGATQSSSPLTSMPVFGASSSSSFGSSVPAFGASSSPAFGNTSSTFGKPAFGGFGSNTVQASPFGSTFEQFQPAFGNSLFGSAQFGASSQPAFGASTTPAFGSASIPAFGATTSPAFGAASTPAFSSTTSLPLAAQVLPLASQLPLYLDQVEHLVHLALQHLVRLALQHLVLQVLQHLGHFGSSPVFGQSMSTFGSSAFGASTSPFGTQSSPFGAQATTPSFGNSGFGQSSFGGQRGGSRVSGYSPTSEVDSGTSQPAGKLESISAMPVYKDKSQEELRWEDYQLGDKGSSVFGQKPAFGGFGPNTVQASPFGSAFGQSQPAFENNLFGSAQFGASSQLAFGASTTPAFGSASTPAFGAASSPAFGAASTPSFGSTTSQHLVAQALPLASQLPLYLDQVEHLVHLALQHLVRLALQHMVLQVLQHLGHFGSSPVFGHSMSALGGSAFGASTSPFGTQSSPFGAQATTPSFGSLGFGQSSFGGQHGGSRGCAYSPTPEVDSGIFQPGNLESISAMPVYKDKSHEELRWEDYQLGDKGGLSHSAQSSGGAIGFGATNTQTNPSTSSSTFGQSSTNPFSSTTSSNPFASKPSAFGGSGFGSSTTATFGYSPVGTSTTSNPFGSTSSATTSVFGVSSPAFGTNSSPSLFGSSSSNAFGSIPSIFGSAKPSGKTSIFSSGLSFGNTKSSPLFQSTTPTLGQANPVFGPTTPSFGQSTPAFGQSNLFSTPSTGFAGEHVL